MKNHEELSIVFNFSFQCCLAVEVAASFHKKFGELEGLPMFVAFYRCYLLKFG